MKLYELKAMVREAREVAENEARQHYTTVQSRGIELKYSGDCEPIYLNRLTMKALNEFIANSPKGSDIWVQGGFDGADSPRDMMESNYETWVSEWALCLKVENGKIVSAD